MKRMTVVFSPLALDDVGHAVEYYEEKQTGLGKRFSGQLQLTLQSIKINPFFTTTRYDEIRCARIKKFPYLIHYQINEKESLVTIIAVYSTYKEPFW